MENFEGLLGAVASTMFDKCLPPDTTIPVIVCLCLLGTGPP